MLASDGRRKDTNASFIMSLVMDEERLRTAGDRGQ